MKFQDTIIKYLQLEKIIIATFASVGIVDSSAAVYQLDRSAENSVATRRVTFAPFQLE
jgi:hypothetical protein